MKNDELDELDIDYGALRAEKGRLDLTLQEIADRAKCNYGSVQRVMSEGPIVSLRVIQQIARALGLRVCVRFERVSE